MFSIITYSEIFLNMYLYSVPFAQWGNFSWPEEARSLFKTLYHLQTGIKRASLQQISIFICQKNVYTFLGSLNTDDIVLKLDGEKYYAPNNETGVLHLPITRHYQITDVFLKPQNTVCVPVCVCVCLCVFVCCICVHIHMCRRMHTCKHPYGAQRSTSGAFVKRSPFFFFKTRSLIFTWNLPLIQLGWMSHELHENAWLHLPTAGLQLYTLMPGFYVWVLMLRCRSPCSPYKYFTKWALSSTPLTKHL